MHQSCAQDHLHGSLSTAEVEIKSHSIDAFTLDNSDRAWSFVFKRADPPLAE